QTMTIEDIIRSTPEFKPSRLSSLYSNFRAHKELNPEGYDANIHAWHILLVKLLTQNQFDSAVSVNSQNHSLAVSLSLPPYGVPKCLGIVVDELIAKGVFVPYSEYMAATTSYVRKPGIFSVRGWVHWGLDSIGIIRRFSAALSNGDLKDERYIAWDLLVQLGNRLLSTISTTTGVYSDGLYSNATLFNQLNTSHKINSVDFDMVLKYWSRDISACQIKVIDNITYIKFGQSGITEDDIGIINIKTTLFHLSNRNSELSNRVDQLTSQAKQSLSNKQHVRHLLTQKQILNKSLNTSISSFNELSTILAKINDSQLNHEIYSQLITSSKVLRNLNSKVNIDDVDAIKLDIEDEIKKVDEIGDALFDTEQVEVEEELEAMIRENEEEQVKEQELLNKLGKLNINKPEIEQEKAPLKEKEKELIPS
ncbi:uncharacterized protein SPAPADRAFT_130812, partial [Spathaspora passalidarum NRRL Y-27907]